MNSYFDQKELFLGPQVNQYGSHMIMTDVKKEKKTKYVNLDTRFRDEYNENFNINYNITLDEKIQDVESYWKYGNSALTDPITGKPCGKGYEKYE